VNNTTVISPVTENAALVQEIPLDRIIESKTNPRRVFDELKLRELAAFVPGNKSCLMWPISFCGVRPSAFLLLKSLQKCALAVQEIEILVSDT
jgi:hypothetical protein